MIYTASSLALSALEILANRTNELPDDYVAVSVEIPDDLSVIRLSEAQLRPTGGQILIKLKLGISAARGLAISKALSSAFPLPS